MHPIAFYRKAKGLTQTELGALVGVSLTTVQNWEQGAGPRPRFLPKLAEALDVDARQLLTELESWKRSAEGNAVAAA